MLIHFTLPLLLATAQCSGSSFFPAGIKNEGSFCYLSTTLQTLFAVHSFRKAVLDSEAIFKDISLDLFSSEENVKDYNKPADVEFADIKEKGDMLDTTKSETLRIKNQQYMMDLIRARMHLAGVFARLQEVQIEGFGLEEGERQFQSAISIGPDFYARYAKSIMEHHTGLGLNPFQLGDPSDFMAWLRKILPSSTTAMMDVTMEKTLAYEGVLYSTTNELRDSVEIFVPSSGLGKEAPAQNLEDLLDRLGADVVEAKIYEPTDDRIRQELRLFGVQFDKGNYYVQETYKIKTAGTILQITAKRENNQFRDESAKLNFPPALFVNGEDYFLTGLVIGVPGHFKAVVSTNPLESIWFEIDDSITKRIPAAEVFDKYRHQVAVLTYVKGEELLPPKFQSNFKANVPTLINEAVEFFRNASREDNGDKVPLWKKQIHDHPRYKQILEQKEEQERAEKARRDEDKKAKAERAEARKARRAERKAKRAEYEAKKAEYEAKKAEYEARKAEHEARKAKKMEDKEKSVEIRTKRKAESELKGAKDKKAKTERKKK